MPTKSSDKRLQGTAKADSAPRPALEAAGEAGLGRIVERARMLAALDERLRRCLPDSLQPHCRLGNAGAGKLVYLVDAPVWGTLLRHHADALLDAAAAAGLQAGALTVKISPPLPSEPAAKARKPLSQATRDALRKTAESVADPELRAQLLRLASIA
ncbi:MAG TPA: DciA family protein [Xanthomonadaceae bacterium]